MKTVELNWQKADNNWYAQGVRRVYYIECELLGNNRFRPCIKVGALTFKSDIPFDSLEDAKRTCQREHDKWMEEKQDAYAQGMTDAAGIVNTQMAPVPEATVERYTKLLQAGLSRAILTALKTKKKELQ